MHRESLIAEQIVAKIGIGRFEPASAPNSEFDRIATALRSICDVRQSHRFTIYCRVHTVVHSMPGSKSEATVCTQRADGGVAARIVLEVEECPAQRVCLEFTLVDGFGHYPASLEATFNPTTILVGNNVHPATIADSKTGEIRRFPSSDPKVMQRINRMGFDLLEELSRQATKTAASLFHPDTRALIQRGDVHVVRAQCCAYLPTPDVPKFLQTIALMYDHAIAEGKAIVRIANHLGLSFCYFPNGGEPDDTTGVMMVKAHGNKPLFSLVFYDKRKRVADTKQGKSLSPEESATVRDNVRFDITLHSAGIVTIVGLARRRLQRLMSVLPSFGAAWRKEFLAGEPASSVWFLERAVFILSQQVRDEALTRRSFSEWLVPYMTEEVLRLDVLGSFSRANLHRLATLADPIAAAWRDDKTNDPRGWAKRVARAAGCSIPTVYSRRVAWLDKFGVDIGAPFAAYRDILLFGAKSVMPADQRWAFLDAGQANRPADMQRIFEAAARDFERRRREIVGQTISRAPLAIEIKVASKKAPGPASRRADAYSALFPSAANERTDPLPRSSSATTGPRADVALRRPTQLMLLRAPRREGEIRTTERTASLESLHIDAATQRAQASRSAPVVIKGRFRS